jgi:hypothetical protein
VTVRNGSRLCKKTLGFDRTPGAGLPRGPGRSRLLQRRAGAGLRENRCCALHPHDGHITRSQSWLIHTPLLHLRRQERSLHLPGWPTANQEPTPADPPRRHGRLSSSDSVLHLPAQTEVHAGQLKRFRRWQHEGVLDQMQVCLDRMPEAMSVRRQTAEHPFAPP